MGSTNIEWSQRTWNPLAGCSMCSPGCARCYAETMGKRIKAMALKDVAVGKDPGRKRHYLDVIGDNGKWNGKISLIPEALDEPLRRKKPTTWFVNSMSDLFHEGVPFDYVDKVFAVIALTPRHTYQILTKRPERMAEYMNRPDWNQRVFGDGRDAIGALDVNLAMEVWLQNVVSKTTPVPVPLANIWLGTSVEDQKRKTRIDALRDVPAAVRFLSLEPLLEDLGTLNLDGIHWVIVGGESGHGARPCNVAWVRSIVEQCRAAGTACFVKQLGAHPIDEICECGDFRQQHQGDGPCGVCCQDRAPYDGCERFRGTGRFEAIHQYDSKGGNMAEWPEDLRIREMPNQPQPEVSR